MKKSMFILIAVLALLFGIWANIATKSDFTTLDSQKNSWSSLQGKWVVINYFAEWCVPCLREIPELNKFHQQHNPNILLYGVSFDKVTRAQLKCVKKHPSDSISINRKLAAITLGKSTH
ncbi:TlpA disulfide reductase family protein [Paraglaciecola aquimarina]|uniref:TlpA disulfide reductase family protein n=1 Tax=Paraglaciecola aquimarina TaxID=1235557 RepID=A0ABU3SY82_9ALTE|nr:TlpA disulfide reductase family protein [Paraglaciecola aquimarina]MDU0354964.1 TlpA disulfide reductase family protein [Paraglaciecola aquimarina]